MGSFQGKSLLDFIGRTPMVEIKQLNPNPKVKVLAKLEFVNPGGSVKDRIAKFMIEAAEQSGELTRDKIIIEPTSGNTGIGLALVAAIKGYRLILTMSEEASRERRQILSALGADIMLTPGHLGTDGAIEVGYRLAREHPEKYFLPDQFNNPANIEAHYSGTGLEIWEQTRGRVTDFIASMGTTGTLMGCSKRLKEMNPGIRIIGVEPYLGHKIQGLKNLKEAYVPGIFDRSRIDELVNIDDEDAYEMARRLAREEGIFVGMSSGAAMHVALEKARNLDEGVVVTILPDGGERYLTTPLFVPKEKTTLKFYNVLSSSKEEFQPIRPGLVTMYSCGPALYSTKQIATFRHLVLADLLKRYLRSRGFEVRQVLNLVDIDDRAIQASEEAGQDLKGFTEKYYQEFLADCDTLGVERADEYPRASDHVDDMVALARKLAEKGAAYEKLRSLYFDISRFKDYGKLSGVDLSKIKLGKTVDLDVYEKENPRDFTLFKRSTLADLKKGIYYNTEWGAVRPGWHIQCAAVLVKHLGTQIDIHTGGRDLNFPHYENVNAIGEAVHGLTPARYWIHSELVLVGGHKMSRSLGNAPTVQDLVAKGYSGRVIRYWLFSTHYRKPLTFSQDRLDAAARTLERVDEFVARFKCASLGPGSAELDQYIFNLRQNFKEAMDDDLNVAAALVAFFEFMRKVNTLMDKGLLSRDNIDQIEEVMVQLDQVLGILAPEEEALDKEAQDLFNQREQARLDRNWAEADRLRDELKARGVKIIDTKSGTRWQRV
ncbi:MAG: cysteine--tRNA ligase [Thermodesulfobacteriota bacterium]|nr:cysteine--tRNA ligase [Thermodesulfobacteriota bacterium]